MECSAYWAKYVSPKAFKPELAKIIWDNLLHSIPDTLLLDTDGIEQAREFLGIPNFLPDSSFVDMALAKKILGKGQ
jgi:hypothetical protein